MYRFRLLALGVLIALAGPAVGAARGNLITNGSFETGDFTGWTVSAGATGVEDSSFGYTPEDGTFYAALGNVGGLGTISQSFATVAGQTYTLTYYLASDGATPNEFRTDIDGTTYTDMIDIPRQDYVLYSYNFTAAGTTSTVTFYERNDPAYLTLDNITVLPVPEPSTLVLAGVGGILICARRFRRRRV